MKKYIGKNKKGEIVYYEELHNINQLGNIQEYKENKRKNIDDSNFYYYWMTKNYWETGLIYKYCFWGLVIQLFCLPFKIITRLALGIFDGDWGEDCKNFKDFALIKIVPFCLIIFICIFMYNSFQKDMELKKIKQETERQRLLTEIIKSGSQFKNKVGTEKVYEEMDFDKILKSWE